MANAEILLSGMSPEEKAGLDQQVGYNSAAAFDLDDGRDLEDYLEVGADNYAEAVLLAEEERDWEARHGGGNDEDVSA